MTKIDINRASVETPAPTKERIAAALALAEADCALATAVDDGGSVPSELLQRRLEAMNTYRATAPKKLRTRAEVDAEIMTVARKIGRLYTRTLHEQLDDLCAEPVAETPEQTVGTYPDRTTDSIRELTDEIRASPSGWEPGDRVGTLLAGLLNRVRDAAAIDWGNGYNWSAPVTGAPEQADEPDSVVTANHIRELQLELDGSEKELTEARARIAELQLGEMDLLEEIRVLAAAQTARDIAASASAARIANLEATNATLSADNERFARELLEARNRAKQAEDLCGRLRLDYERQLDAKHEKLVELSAELLEARKPCERRHLTEAEEALCAHFVHIDGRGWGMPPFDRHYMLGDAAALANAVCDERRQQTKEHTTDKGAPVASAGAPDVTPADPEPERCSCEEALKLRRNIEIERRTSRELAQKIRAAIEVLS